MSDADFLYGVVKAIHRIGIVGEDKAILCLLLKLSLRLVKNADALSSNLVLSDDSGSGKDYLVKNLCGFVLPKDSFKSFTRVSEKALNYYKIDWNGKVLHLEDIDKGFLNSGVIKTMASSGSSILVTDVANKDSTLIDIEGKPVLVVTSFGASIDEEGIRRWDYLRLDTSSEQSKAIINSLNLPVVDKKLQKSLHSLKSFNVVVPFGKKVVSVLPCSLNMRSEKVKFLDYIKASAVFCQRFRKCDKQGNLIATWFDYDFARLVFYCFNSGGFSSLNKQQEELFELVKFAPDVSVPIRYLVANSRIGKTTIYQYIDLLKVFGLIGVEYKNDEIANKSILHVFVKDSYSLQYLPVLHHSDFNGLLGRIDDFRKKYFLSIVFKDFIDFKGIDKVKLEGYRDNFYKEENFDSFMQKVKSS